MADAGIGKHIHVYDLRRTVTRASCRWPTNRLPWPSRLGGLPWSVFGKVIAGGGSRSLSLPDDFGHSPFHAESPRSSAISTGGFRCPVSNDEPTRLDVGQIRKGAAASSAPVMVSPGSEPGIGRKSRLVGSSDPSSCDNRQVPLGGWGERPGGPVVPAL